MSNRITSSVLKKFSNQDIRLRPENDESSIASVARLDAWIYVSALIICKELVDKLADG